MKKKSLFLLLFWGILLIGLVSSAYEIGDPSHSIETNYGPSESLRGWINLSLNDEFMDSKLKTNTGNEISVSDLLDLNGVDYNCIPSDCETSYDASSPSASKTFTLNDGDSAYYGLKIVSGGSGEVYSISDFNLNVETNAGASSSPQISIDIFDDGITDWNPTVSSGTYRTKNYGCFEEDDILGNAKILSGIPYCERVTLSPAPSVKIGASIDKISSSSPDNIDFDMTIRDVDNSQVGNCVANPSNSGESGRITPFAIYDSTDYTISCTPNNFPINEEKSFYVCINARDSSGNEQYSVPYERTSSCGYSGSSPSGNAIDFALYGSESNYASLNGQTLTLNDNSIVGIDSEIMSYIESEYNGMCSEGCIIPIKITSGANQQVTLSGASLSYLTDIDEDTSSIYDVENSVAKISTDGYVKLNLDDSGLNVGNDYGPDNIRLYFKNTGERIFDEDIFIERVPEINYITPSKTAAAIPTKFSAGASSTSDSSQIVRYDWSFGDGKNSTTYSPNVTHIYDEIGNYSLRLTVRDSENLQSSKKINVTVTSPKSWINETLDRLKSNLDSYETSIEGFDSFTKQILNEKYDTTNIRTQLTEIERDFRVASSDATYASIADRLVPIDIPEKVYKSSSADDLTFYPGASSINLDWVKELEGETFDSSKREQLTNQLVAWNVNNFDIKLSLKEFQMDYEDHKEYLFTVFDFYFDKEVPVDNNIYFVIENLNGLEFKNSGDSPRKESEFTYIPISSTPKTITFATTETLDFLDLKAFLTPPISAFSTESGPITPSGSEFKWTIFILVLLFIFLIAIGAYIFLQIWYKRKYESHLFRDRNDLYNLIHYINNMKKRGMKDSEISSSLRKSKWNSEQIRYVLRKYAGKRTGLAEIPVDKIARKFENPKRRDFRY